MLNVKEHFLNDGSTKLWQMRRTKYTIAPFAFIGHLASSKFEISVRSN